MPSRWVLPEYKAHEDLKPIQLDGPCGYVVSAYRVDGEACVLLRSSSRVVREMFVDEALTLATLLQIAAGYARNGKMPHDI